MSALERLVETLSMAIYRNEAFGIIYDNDPDGVFSCFLLTRMMRDFGAEFIDIFPANHAFSINGMVDNAYRHISTHFPRSRQYNIVILDLTIKAEDIIHHLYEAKNTRIMVIDHHAQSKEEESRIADGLKRRGDKEIFLPFIDDSGENSTASLTSSVVLNAIRYCDREKYFVVGSNLIETYKKLDYLAELVTQIDIWNVTSSEILGGESSAVYIDCHLRMLFEQKTPQAAYRDFCQTMENILDGTMVDVKDIFFHSDAIDNFIISNYGDEFREMILNISIMIKEPPVYSEYGPFFFMETYSNYRYINYLSCIILSNRPEINAVAIKVLDQPNKISLRSRKSDTGISVGRLSREMGGGGHDTAGGFSITTPSYIEKVRIKKKDQARTIFFTPSVAKIAI